MATITKTRMQLTRIKHRGDGYTKVVTQNCSPAPSQSDAVIIGVEIQINPFSWKNLWVAYAKAFLILITYNVQ